MADVLALSNTGSFYLEGGASFDPKSISSWQDHIIALSFQNSAGGSGNVGAFNVFGPTTLTFTVRPVASGITTAPGILYVYTRDANNQPTIQSFAVGGGGFDADTVAVTYMGGSGQSSGQPVAGAVYLRSCRVPRPGELN